jgi:hypothetical protein
MAERTVSGPRRPLMVALLIGSLIGLLLLVLVLIVVALGALRESEVPPTGQDEPRTIGGQLDRTADGRAPLPGPAGRRMA